MNVRFKMDASQMRYAVEQIESATGKLPSQIVNRAIFSAAIRVKKAMPVVSVSQIDSELGAAVQLRQKKNGKYKRSGNLISGGKMGNKVRSVPLAKLIVLARANIAGLNRKSGTGSVSNFNVTTNSRYAIDKSEFRNKQMDAYVSRMIKTRHSSSGFFKTCAAAIMFLFKSSDRGQSGGFVPPVIGDVTSGGKISARIGKIAGGEVAKNGSSASASFWVSGTLADTKNALYSVAEPVWQKGIDDEARFMHSVAERAYSNTFKKLGFK